MDREARETSKDPYLSALGYEGKGGLYRVPKRSVNYPPGTNTLKQIAESHVLDIRTEVKPKKMGVAF